jgi:hypothetical protein
MRRLFGSSHISSVDHSRGVGQYVGVVSMEACMRRYVVFTALILAFGGLVQAAGPAMLGDGRTKQLTPWPLERIQTPSPTQRPTCGKQGDACSGTCPQGQSCKEGGVKTRGCACQ